MKNPKTNNVLRAIANIFIRFNVTLFIITLAGGLVIAVITLTNIMQPTNDDLLGPGVTGPSSFDDATIERLNNLGANSSQNLPSGRINPFAG